MTITDMFTVAELLVFVSAFFYRATFHGSVHKDAFLFAFDLVLPIFVIEVVGRVFRWF